MRRIVLGVFTMALAIGFLPPAQAKSTTTKLVVSANGANEKPNQGSRVGSASGTFLLNPTKNTFCFVNMKMAKLTNVIGAHVHLGSLGFEGSIFVNFNYLNFNRLMNTCVKIDASVLAEIIKHPSDYYFNVHTKEFPRGAVRGQLRISS